jgi:cytochrome c peroxidase
MKQLICYLLATILLLSCKKEGCTDDNALNYNPEAEVNNGSCQYYDITPYTIITPAGFPDMIIPENNPTTLEGIALGEKLFNDPILSSNNTLSCVDCHIKNSSFSDPNQLSIGIDGFLGNRNASTLINLGWNSSFNWDGSAKTSL